VYDTALWPTRPDSRPKQLLVGYEYSNMHGLPGFVSQLVVITAGSLRQIEALLGSATALRNFTSHLGGVDMGPAWAFACRYRLKSVLRLVEQQIQIGSLQTLTGLEGHALSLPPSSTDMVISSLARMALGFRNLWDNMANELEAKSEEVPNQMSFTCSEVQDLLATFGEEFTSVYGPAD
jgi:hypothetical protein